MRTACLQSPPRTHNLHQRGARCTPCALQHTHCATLQAIGICKMWSTEPGEKGREFDPRGPALAPPPASRASASIRRLARRMKMANTGPVASWMRLALHTALRKFGHGLRNDQAHLHQLVAAANFHHFGDFTASSLPPVFSLLRKMTKDQTMTNGRPRNNVEMCRCTTPSTWLIDEQTAGMCKAGETC